MAEFYMNDSDSDYDSEEEQYEDIVYEPEEPNNSRFVIALCEIFNDKIHGAGPQGHYLAYCRYKKLHMDWIEETSAFVNLEYHYLHNLTHDLHPNYREIIMQHNYVKPEIVECIYLKPYDHCIAIIKTFWIKIIQRAWKNVLKKRQHIQKSIATLRHRELTGRWPAIPGLRGLLTR
jgi:hypothetical protein